MKQIIFTVQRGEFSIFIKTKSLLADPVDQEKKIPAACLFDEMRKLSKKYNDKNIAVLFECD